METKRFSSVTIQLQNHLPYAGLKQLVGTVATSGLLATSKTYYDDAGRVEFTVDSAGLISKFSYDAAGRQETMTQYLTGRPNDPGDPISVVEETPGAGVQSATTTFQYDAAGRQTVVTNAREHSTRTIYDELGRVTKTIFHDGTVPGQLYQPGNWQPQFNPYVVTSLPGIIGLPPITIQARNVGHGVIAYTTDLTPETVAIFVSASVEIARLVSTSTAVQTARAQLQPALATMISFVGGFAI